MNYSKLLFSVFLIFCLGEVSSQEKKRTRILFIFDASNSMNTEWEGSSRIAIAKKVMASTLDSLSKIEGLELGLRMYGHQSAYKPPKAPDCNDTKLEVPIGLNTSNSIKEKIRAVVPKGTTPIAISLEKSAMDFTECSDCNNVIILVTDGVEACDGDPCAVSKALRSKNISVRPFVIGIGIDLSYIEQLACIGNAYNANDAKSFQNLLNLVVNEAMNSTTAQINLNNLQGKPTQTNVPITLYDRATGEMKYHFIHTLNGKNNPDTISIDPVYKYKMVVHSIPQVIKDNITIEPGKHNTIEADAPMGTLELKVRNDFANSTSIKCIVRKDGETKTLNSQPFNLKQRYLDGTYDLEILTLPRIYMEDVVIKQDETYPIEIPYPGTLDLRTVKSSIGSIFKINENGEYEWLYTIDENKLTQLVQMQPGKYAIVYRYKNMKRTAYSQEVKFTINTQKTTILTI